MTTMCDCSVASYVSKSICRFSSPRRKCPLAYMLKHPNGNRKWAKYHGLLQSLDDKKNSIGYWWGQAYYNNQDAVKCNEHFRNFTKWMHPTTKLPLYQVYYMPKEEEYASFAMQRNYARNFTDVVQLVSRQEPEMKYHMVEKGWIPHESFTFDEHLSYS